MDIQNIVDADPAGRKAMDQPDPVFIEERAGIDPTGDRLDQMALPGTGRILRGPGVQPLVRHAGVNIKQALMITEARCPDTAAMGGPIIPRGREAVSGISDDLPMHQIPGM